MSSTGKSPFGLVLPGLPQILLCPEKNPGWEKLFLAFQQLRSEMETQSIDGLILYSTYWPSVIGHQIQSYPEPQWTHVDDEFHDLGSIPYHFRVDSDLAQTINEQAKARGLHSRTVSYKGFPIDTGCVVALKLLNPDNRWPVVIVSSNVYADRAETIVFGKAAKGAIESSGKNIVPIIITSLSNRLHTHWIRPEEDHIHSLKDQEWNQKILEFLSAGRLEDVSQLSRQFHREARVPKVANFKPFWWLASVLGQNNFYTGRIYEYQPVFGSGAAIISLTPSDRAARDLEFDENDPEKFLGERQVIS
ncbi:MAG: hypothetical protein K1X29_08100 [Bdellovibrionales bacterium]|nr:hypothetical protein [Bdellovibrionales bacterium]